MKKIFTLLVSVTLFASAFAQYRTGGDKDFGNKGRDGVYNDGYKKGNDRDRGDNYYSFSMRERDMQIAQINREYDRKIMEVRNRFFMPRYKKEQMVYQLNDQRNFEIKKVYARFSSRDNHYDDHDWRRH
jgi:hypothetical protein